MDANVERIFLESMAPAQPMMDIDQDTETNYTLKLEPDEENPSLSANSDEIGLRCLIKQEEPTICMEALQLHSKTSKWSEDVDVDIIECTNNIDTRLLEVDDLDATECSSSFGDSVSDTGKCDEICEAEVESQFFADNAFPSACDAFTCMFETRKRRLTNHWRSFIRPLMWRCKWTELRIKEIESQALKYSRELAAHDLRKHYLGINPSTLEGCGSKSLPFSSQYYKTKPIKRRKRKKIEKTTDVASYMSQHNLFGYIENKRSNPDVTSMADDFGNTAMADQHDDCIDKSDINNDESLLEFRDCNNSLEQILWKIEIVHSRVHKLKCQVDVIMSKTAAKFSSLENLSLLAPNDVQTSSVPSPTFSAGNGDTISVGAIYNPSQHMPEYDIGELVLPESAISNYGEAFHVPDIIESTVGLLSAADVTFHQPQMGDSCEDILENVLIHNQPAEGDGHTLVRMSNETTEKHHENEPEKGEEGESVNPSSIPTLELDPAAKSTASQKQSTLKSCFATDFQFPTNKRKRGERKASSGGWSKKCSGEPDSQ
ncbi:hypothetical protein CFOL_v3_10042 [Cephalotus follicularis]|uniref:Uncharacterized protein n=1 Tax=Cephalotus follicularis TaxID=3775 RepID=A0A1Q3BFB1_CEPFO|nr:hypothetical protein CFOL_v3_10042 [Cephalotus follicularis]